MLSEEDESIYREIHKRSSAIKAIVDKTPSGLGIALDRNSKKIPESAGEPKPQKYLALYDINPIMKYYWTLGIFGCIAVGASAAIFAYFFVEIYEVLLFLTLPSVGSLSLAITYILFGFRYFLSLRIN